MSQNLESERKLQNTTAMAIVKPPSKVRVTWAGEHRFDGQRQSGGPPIRMDASGKTGPGPVDTLLCALAGCTSIDVVDILAKRKTPVESLTVDVVGDRFPGIPARVTNIQLAFKMTGANIEREQAERAIELSVTKYCTVRDSLNANITVGWALELNGTGGAGLP